MAEPAPACPRCAYDLSGIVASWTEECPLEGVCSECGLGFGWRNILNWSLTVPRWSFEHTRRVSVVAWGLTNGRALNPLAFWRGLRLEHPVNVVRLIAGVAAVLLAVHVCIAGATVWRAYNEAVGVMTTTPARMLSNGTIVRGPTPPRPSAGTIFGAHRDVIAGAALWPYRPLHVQRGFGGVRWSSYGFESLTGLWTVFIAAFWMTIAPGFLVLGETFRRCKVRLVHLVRGFAYSLAGPGVAVIGATVYFVAGPAVVRIGAISINMRGDVRLGAIAAACAWLGVYWSVFVVRYLRLTHAAWVAVCMLLIAGLSASVATTLAWLGSMGKLW